MLTATYSLVAIAAEQERARGLLQRLQQYIQTVWKGMDFPLLENAFERLLQLDGYCRSRKLEVYLMPALRFAAKEAETLMVELEAIGSKCRDIVRLVGRRLETCSLDSVRMSETLQAMENYCNYLVLRFEKEERELLPMARQLLSVEEWFALAANFLSDDSGADERRRQGHPIPRGVEEKSRPAWDAR